MTIKYSETKVGDILMLVGEGAPGYAKLGDFVRVVSVDVNAVTVENQKGEPTRFLHNCGAARLEPTEWREDFPSWSDVVDEDGNVKRFTATEQVWAQRCVIAQWVRDYVVKRKANMPFIGPAEVGVMDRFQQGPASFLIEVKFTGVVVRLFERDSREKVEAVVEAAIVATNALEAAPS